MTVKPLDQLRIDVADALADNGNWEINAGDSRISIIDTIDSLEALMVSHSIVQNQSLATNIWASVPMPADMKRIYTVTAVDINNNQEVILEKRYSGDFLSVKAQTAVTVDLLVTGPRGTPVGGAPVGGSITSVSFRNVWNVLGIDAQASVGIPGGLLVEYREVGTTQWRKGPRAIETPLAGRYCSNVFNQPGGQTLIKHNTEYEVTVSIEGGDQPDQAITSNTTTLVDRVLIPHTTTRRVEVANTAELNAALIDLREYDQIVLTGPGPYRPSRIERVDKDFVTIEGSYLPDQNLVIESIVADTFTVAGSDGVDDHNFVDNDVVWFTTNGVMPTGMPDQHRIYYVRDSGLTGPRTFKICDEFGEPAISASGGTGTLRVHKHNKPVLSGSYDPGAWQVYTGDIWETVADIPGVLSELYALYVNGTAYRYKNDTNNLQPNEWDVSGAPNGKIYANFGPGQDPNTKTVLASGDPFGVDPDRYSGQFAFRQQGPPGGANLTLKNLTFEHYHASDPALGGQAAGVLLRLGDITITNCCFRFNHLGVFHQIETVEDNRRMLIDNCCFQAESKYTHWNDMKETKPGGDNSEFFNGIISAAGLPSYEHGQITVRNCTFADGRSCIFVVHEVDDNTHEMQTVHYDNNIFVRTMDNCIEMDGWCCGHVATRNQMLNSLEPVSIQPMRHGPAFIVGNKWDCGWQTEIDAREWQYASGIKHSNGLIGVIWCVNNTIVAAPQAGSSPVLNACAFWMQGNDKFVPGGVDITHHWLLMSNNILTGDSTGSADPNWCVFIDGPNSNPGNQQWNDNIYHYTGTLVSGVAAYLGNTNLTWDQFMALVPSSITSTDTTANNEADPLLINGVGASKRWDVLGGSPAIGTGVPVEGVNDQIQNLSKGWQLDAS